MLVMILWFMLGIVGFFAGSFAVECYKEKWYPGVFLGIGVILFGYWIVKSISDFMTVVYLY